MTMINPQHSAKQILAAVRKVLICKICGKQSALMNTARRGRRWVSEQPSPKVHCACPGGPAFGAGETQ